MPNNAPSVSNVEGEVPSVGELVGLMSEQTSRLIRNEFRLAKAEMTERERRVVSGPPCSAVPG